MMGSDHSYPHMWGSSKRPHVVIIGSGIIGAMMAWEFSKYDVRVTVVEKGKEVAAATSSNSFGWINAFEKAGNDNYFDLNFSGLKLWHEFNKECEKRHIDIGYQSGGSVFTADNAEHAEILKSKVQYAQKRDYNARFLSYEEFKVKVPGATLPKESYISGAICPEEVCVDAKLAAQACIKMAQKEKSIELLTGTEVTNLKLGANGIESVEITQGEEKRSLDCDHVVLAAGNGSPKMAQTVGVTIPLIESPGVITKTTLNDRPLLNQAAVVHFLSNNDPVVTNHHAKQQLVDDKWILVFGRGTQSHAYTDDSPQAHEKLVQYWKKRFPETIGAEVQAVPSNKAYRVMPKDGLPIYGCPEDLPNFFVAVSHSGVTLAPVVAKLAVQELLDRKSSPELNSFRPDRFAEKGQTKVEEVEDLSSHSLKP